MENTVTAAPVREGMGTTGEYIIVNTEVYADKDGNVVSRYDPSAVRCLAGPGGVIEKSFAERWGITGTMYVEGEPQPVVGALNTPTAPGVVRDSADEEEAAAGRAGEEETPTMPATTSPAPPAPEPLGDIEHPLGVQLVSEAGEVEQIGQDRTLKKYRK